MAGQIVLGPFPPVSTVTGLPSCTGARKGQVWGVSDATSKTVLGAGGGSIATLVQCSGSAWEPLPDGAGGSSLQIDESDGTPSVSNVSEINFDQADGFTLTDDTGGVVTIGFSGSPGSGSIPSLLTALGSEDAESCEFTSGVCAGWVWTLGDVTPTSQTLNPIDSSGLTGPGFSTSIYAGGWLGVQVKEASTNAEEVILSNAVTLSTDMTIVMHASCAPRGMLGQRTDNGGSCGLMVCGAADCVGDNVAIVIDESDSATATFNESLSLLSCTSGSCSTALDEADHYALMNGGFYLAIYKDATVWHFFLLQHDYGTAYLGNVTRTDSDLDTIAFWTRTTTADPAPLYAIDFVRIYTSHVFDLWQ